MKGWALGAEAVGCISGESDLASPDGKGRMGCSNTTGGIEPDISISSGACDFRGRRRLLGVRCLIPGGMEIGRLRCGSISPGDVGGDSRGVRKQTRSLCGMPWRAGRALQGWPGADHPSRRQPANILVRPPEPLRSRLGRFQHGHGRRVRLPVDDVAARPRAMQRRKRSARVRRRRIRAWAWSCGRERADAGGGGI